METQNKNLGEKVVTLLWVGVAVFCLALLFARTIFPELVWLTVILVLPLLGMLGALTVQYQKALRSRTAAYGVNSIVTVILVIGIVGVLNFLVSRYPLKLDTTKNKIHTLSDQTTKLISTLQKPVKAIYFAKMNQKEGAASLLSNYKALSPKFEVEYVDPDREPTRAKQNGIRKYGTLMLSASGRESKIEEVTEEKLTNALIKLLKDKSTTLCALTGHGEKSFTSQEAEGYETVRKALTEQSYDLKDVNLVQDPKALESCDGLAVVGPVKSFFEAETKAVSNYLENGGRAFVALDLNLKGPEYSPELNSVLEKWYVRADRGLVVDPLSRMLGVDSSVAIVASFSKDHAITKGFQGNAFFPFSRPIEILSGAPSGLQISWIGQTTPKSWMVSDMSQIARGEVKFVEGKDKQGPLNAAVAVEGKQKDSKATKSTRLVVFGTSFFGTNNFARYGNNVDFVLNAFSWMMEDDNLISIRAKEDSVGKVELSQKSGTFIFLLTVVVVPLLIAAAGVVIWIFRRRM